MQNTKKKKARISRVADHVPTARIDPKFKPRVIYGVPLQGEGNKVAEIYAEDYERITANGCPRKWYAKAAKSGEYVAVKSERRGKNKEAVNNVSVAWLVLGIWPDDRLEVTYKDGDRFNLRSDNLVPRPRDNNPHVEKARDKHRGKKPDEGGPAD